jgi:hypothetical protein
MARAIRTGEPHRADGALAYHVLDVLESVLEAAAQDQPVDVASTVDRPAAVPSRDIGRVVARSLHMVTVPRMHVVVAPPTQTVPSGSAVIVMSPVRPSLAPWETL